MTYSSTLATIAALIGDPSRANMLQALMSEGRLSATELAAVAGVAPATASEHLGKLAEARLVAIETRGRHRYYRIASPDVAHMLEAILVVAEAPGRAPTTRRAVPRVPVKLRLARTCYDHLAGRLGVALAESLVDRQWLMLGAEVGEVTPDGARFLTEFGLSLHEAKASRRLFCRPCLDWSERRPHIAGVLGAALLQRLEALHWVARGPDRFVAITAAGRDGLGRTFGLDMAALQEAGR